MPSQVQFDQINTTNTVLTLASTIHTEFGKYFLTVEGAVSIRISSKSSANT